MLGEEDYGVYFTVLNQLFPLVLCRLIMDYAIEYPVPGHNVISLSVNFKQKFILVKEKKKMNEDLLREAKKKYLELEQFISTFDKKYFYILITIGTKGRYEAYFQSETLTEKMSAGESPWLTEYSPVHFWKRTEEMVRSQQN